MSEQEMRRNPEKHSPWFDDIERSMWFAGGVWVGARHPDEFSPWILALMSFSLGLLIFRVMPYAYRLTGKLPYFSGASQKGDGET